jgi:hypothetical protein
VVLQALLRQCLLLLLLLQPITIGVYVEILEGNEWVRPDSVLADKRLKTGGWLRSTHSM